jgi:hypothetical protein
VSSRQTMGKIATYQSRQLVRKTPFCSVMISSELVSDIVNPNRSTLSVILSSRLPQTQSVKLRLAAKQKGNHFKSLMTLSCPPSRTAAWKS